LWGTLFTTQQIGPFWDGNQEGLNIENSTILEKDTDKRLSVISQSFQKGISSMKNASLSIAKFVSHWAMRGANYWVFEPGLNMGKRVMWSVRYFTFLTMVAGSIYGYNNPEGLKNFALSCLPKITVEAPEILK
jgi:hypothetical protein